MTKHYNIIIIGGGAGGMVSAIEAKKQAPSLSVAILEKNDRVGKKLLTTGNGRCNIANIDASLEDYFTANGENPDFILPAMREFSVSDNLKFFENLGVYTKVEADGKVYPTSDQASSVLDMLRFKLADLEIDVITQCEVTSLVAGTKQKIQSTQGSFSADATIIAIGGIASPQVSNCQGFEKLLGALGHKSTTCYPALTQVKTDNQLTKALKGVKFVGTASLYEETAGKMLKIGEERGEILFTEYGVSAPPIFQLSRLVAKNFSQKQPKKQEIRLNIMDNYSKAQLLEILDQRCNLNVTLENYLTGMLNKKLGQQLLKHSGFGVLSPHCSTLTAKDLHKIANNIQNLTLEVHGTTGWQKAQVMTGGIELQGINPETMESKKTKNIYLTGEILDVCGSCGGYNLSWVWSSGRLAGKKAAEKLTGGGKNATN